MLTTLVILGAAQGIFLGISLLGRKVNTTANRVLALVMFVSAIFLLFGLYYAESYYLRWPHLIGLGQPLVFLFGPTLYLYALLVSSGGQTFKKIWLLHFLPYFLNMLYFTPFFFGSAAAKIEMVHATMANGAPLDIRLIENLKYVQGIIYVALTIRLLQRHRARLKDRFSSIERINLNWLRYLTIGIVAVWTVAILEWIVGFFLADSPSIDIYTGVAVTLFVCATGYMGLSQPEIFGTGTWSCLPTGTGGLCDTYLNDGPGRVNPKETSTPVLASRLTTAEADQKHRVSGAHSFQFIQQEAPMRRGAHPCRVRPPEPQTLRKSNADVQCGFSHALGCRRTGIGGARRDRRRESTRHTYHLAIYHNVL